MDNGNNRPTQMAEHNHWVRGTRGTCPGCIREKEQREKEDAKWWGLGVVCLLVLVVTGWFQGEACVRRKINPPMVNGREAGR